MKTAQTPALRFVPASHHGLKNRTRHLVVCAGIAASLLFVATGCATTGVHAEVPFDGSHQAGIQTPIQTQLFLAAFDATAPDVGGLRSLFRDWTAAARKLTKGKPLSTTHTNPALPPRDTGEALGLDAADLTLTFGVGPSLFDSRYGLSAKRPAALADLPAFQGDALEARWSGGDIVIQAAANDTQVAYHAIHELARIAQGRAVLRWVQQGFAGAQTQPGATDRNLQGFKDGTVNPRSGDRGDFDSVVWAGNDGPSWMVGGSYMVVRRIRMFVEVWDRSSLHDQEAAIGRDKAEGAPLGASGEHADLDLQAHTDSGAPIIPETSHVRLAHGDGSEQILRRGFSYVEGLDPLTGQWDAGLIFIAFQADPREQFIPIQRRLAASDALNEYVKTIGSAVFACFPGVDDVHYIGEGLFS